MATKETAVLDIDVGGFKGGIKDAIAALQKLDSALEAVEDQAKKAGKAAEDTDDKMSGMSKGAAALAGGIAGLTSSFVNLVGKGIEKSLERLVELGEENDQIGGKINDLKAVFDDFLKLLLPAFEVVLDVILNLADWIEKLWDSFDMDTIVSTSDVLSDLSSMFDSILMQLSPLWDSLKSVWKIILDLYSVVWTLEAAFFKLLINALEPIWKAVSKFVAPAFQKLADVLAWIQGKTHAVVIATNELTGVNIDANTATGNLIDGIVGLGTAREAQHKSDGQTKKDTEAQTEAEKELEQAERELEQAAKDRAAAEKKRYEDGIKLGEQQRKMLDSLRQSYQKLTDNALTPLQKAQKENLEEQNKVREALQFGAGDADELRKMLEELQKAYNKLTEEAEKLAKKEKANKTFENIAFWTNQAVSAVNNLITGATSLLGVFGQIGSGDIIGGLTSIVNAIGAAFEGLGKRISDVTQKLAEKLDIVGTNVGKTVGLAIGALGSIIGVIGGLLAGLQSLVEGLTGFSFTDLLNADPAALAEIFGTAGENLLQKLEQFPNRLVALLGDGRLLELVEKTVKGVVEAFDKVLPDVVDFLVNVLGIVFQSLPALVDTLIESLPTLVNNLIETLAASLPELLPKLVELAVGLVVAIVDAVPEIVVALIKALPKLLLELGKGIFKIAFELLQVVPEILMQIVEAMKDAILGFIEKILRSLGLDKAADRVADKAAGNTPTGSFNDTPGVQNVGPRGANYSFAPGDMVIAAKTLEGLQRQVNVNVNQDQVVMEQRLTRIAIENLANEMKYTRSQNLFNPTSVAGY